MFKNLRQGQSLYILHKEDKLYHEVATITSVDNLRAKAPMTGMLPYGAQEMLVDIKAKIGSDNLTLPAIPADVVITDYKPNNGEKLVLSCDLAAFNSEINSIMQQSKQELARTEYNNSVIEGCEKMLVALNPEFAREKERESEMSNMKNEMSQLKETNEKLMSMMKELLDKQSSNNKKST
ncbi:hypothetical protein [Parabacteroides goldsteinii]|uniref:hypothetical protein n=1 Tax=Parabacteroides goldsteinii TaxID=328812 RepID=UPI0026765930|nr:hypothetical protein [Parabacteroides goldsteinii]